MTHRTTLSGFAARITSACVLATAACAAPSGLEGEDAAQQPVADPAPPNPSSGSGTDEVTGLQVGAGGAAGGAAGSAGAAGEAGAPSGGAGGAPTFTPGLEGAWSFEEVGATTALDDSGHDHHGALVGSGVAMVKGGKVGATASFSGGDARISIPGASSLDFLKAATIEAWVKLSGFTSGSILARVSASGDGVRIRTSQGNVQVSFTRAGMGSAIVTSDPNVLSTGWTHVAVVNDGSSLKLYVNGKLHRSEAGGQLGAVSADLVIGKSGQDSALNGYVDELKWWSIARSNEEICSDAGGVWTNGECVL